MEKLYYYSNTCSIDNLIMRTWHISFFFGEIISLAFSYRIFWRIIYYLWFIDGTWNLASFLLNIIVRTSFKLYSLSFNYFGLVFIYPRPRTISFHCQRRSFRSPYSDCYCFDFRLIKATWSQLCYRLAN